MQPIRILVDTFADAGLTNAQMGNAREIIARLDPDVFHVSAFVLGTPEKRMASRKNTRLVQLPARRQTVRILSEFVLGRHQLLFYMKSSPASKYYLKLRDRWRDRRTTIGTVESECDFERDPGISAEAIRLWEETILRCDYLYSNCSFVQRSLDEEYGIASDVVPTGADTRFFSPDWDRPRNARPTVLFVGSLFHRKRPDVVVSAAARFPEADFRIVGGGALAEGLAARIKKEGLINAKVVGPLAAEPLRDEYRRADIFFFPSEFEGSPKVIVEAAACGLPVVVRSTYSPETVIHGTTGFLGRTDEELLSSLGLLISRPDLWRSFGEAGRRLSTKYDWDGITAQWATVFAELAGASELRRAS